MEETSLQRLSRSTNKRIPMQNDGGTKSAVDPRLIIGLSPVYHKDEKRSLFLAADQWNDAFFVSVYPFHARHIREPMEEQNMLLTSCLSPVFQRDKKRFLFLGADQWNVAFLSP